jgi:putative membrane protein
MGLMWLWWLFGLCVLVVAVWAITRAAGSPALRGDGESPEAVLKRRYARGELDEQEYERTLTNLRK